MKKFLSSRQEKVILTLYLKQDWIKGGDLSDIIGVSDRTIRNDIEVIKTIFNKDLILTSKQFGYKYNRRFEFESLNANDILDPNERIAIVIINLFYKPNGMDYFEISNQLNISESTLLSYIQIIRKYIFEYKFSLKIDKVNDLLYFSGDRLEQLQFVIYWIKEVIKCAKPEDFSKIFLIIDAKSLTSMLLELLVEEKFFSRYLSFRSLLITVLLITEQAVINSKEIHTDFESMPEVYYDSNLVVKIQNRIMDLFKIKLHFNDISLLNQLLSKVKPMEEVEGFRHNVNVLKDPIFVSLRNILLEVKDKFFLDFTHETDLAINLTIHLKIALVRMKNGIELKNPINEQMKREYPFLYDIALYIGTRISSELDIQFSQNELSFIVCHLAEIYEILQKGNIVQEKLKVLIVVLEGKPVLKYILKNNESIFKDNLYIDRVDVTSAFELEKTTENANSYDFIISTSILRIGENLPNLIISPEGNMLDSFSIQAMLSKEIDVLRKKNFSTLVRIFFANSRFYSNQSFKDSIESIQFLSKNLESRKIVNMDFLPSVLERENQISTSLQTGFALPHSTNLNSNKTCVEIMVLKEPLLWGNNYVSIILLFAISRKDIKYLNYFYSVISKLASDESNLVNLKKCSSLEEFITILYEVYIKK